MSIDTSAQDTLKGLSEGEETEWDSISSMVNKGMIRREDAINSLKSCLKIVIPKYIKETQGSGWRGRHYWCDRLTEAETALEAINKGKTVEYRGIQL